MFLEVSLIFVPCGVHTWTNFDLCQFLSELSPHKSRLMPRLVKRAEQVRFGGLGEHLAVLKFCTVVMMFQKSGQVQQLGPVPSLSSAWHHVLF